MRLLIGKPLSRRTALKGLGATVALPFLDAMLPAFSLSGQTAPTRLHRFQTFYVPNGMAMPFWFFDGVGEEFELSPILEPLEPYKDQMLGITGVYANWVQIHAGASGSFLTGIARGGRTEVEIVADVSIDQMLAKHLGNETQLPSLEVSMDAPANAGACSSNLSCVYTHTLSWRGPTQPNPMEHNPRAVFERLFGDSGSADRTARQRRLLQQKSVLDSVGDKLASLLREVGPGDHQRLEQYTDAIRDVERRVQRAEDQVDVELPFVDQPQGVPPVFEDHLDLMLDLQLLALQSDLTRVITFMIGKEQSARPYPQIGVPEAHHPLSHHNNQPDLVEKMSKINRYHTELFAKYLGKLRATPDGDGTLLDNMTLLYGSGISNSTFHSGDNLPLLLMGGHAGRIATGRHLEYDDKPSMANLLVTLLDRFDVPVEKLGASTGALPLDTLSGL